MRFGKIYSEIMERVDLSPRAKLVAAALDMFCNPKTGQCNPELDKLMQATGTSKTSLHRAMVELIEAGLIDRKKEGKFEQSFTLSWSTPKVQPAEPDDSTGGINDSTGGINDSTGGTNDSTGGINIPRAEQPHIMEGKRKEKKKEKKKEKGKDSFEEKEKEKGEEISFREKLLKRQAHIRKIRGMK